VHNVTGSGKDGLWRTTLGDRVFISNIEYEASGTDLSVRRVTYDPWTMRPIFGGWESVSGLSTKGFVTARQYVRYLTMQTINNYVNQFSSADYNNTAAMTDTTVSFNIGHSNYSSNFGDYQNASAVIEGPGMYAIIDVYDGTGSELRLYERVASFGGSELIPDDRGWGYDLNPPSSEEIVDFSEVSTEFVEC
jgi:hypothetical protein